MQSNWLLKWESILFLLRSHQYDWGLCVCCVWTNISYACGQVPMLFNSTSSHRLTYIPDAKQSITNINCIIIRISFRSVKMRWPWQQPFERIRFYFYTISWWNNHVPCWIWPTRIIYLFIDHRRRSHSTLLSSYTFMERNKHLSLFRPNNSNRT